MDMPAKSPLPRPALWLGLAGWIPFWFPVLLSGQALASGRSAAAEEALFTVYAALILSFLGGVRWGREIANNDQPSARVLGLSILGCIAGLAAAFLHWTGMTLMAWTLIAVSLMVHWWWDLRAVEAGELPRWFGRLRALLTAGAVFSALAMSLLYVVARSGG